MTKSAIDMKIMTYNILDGGIDDNGSRIEHIIDVINEESPDFLAIQEATNFAKNDNELLKRLSKETKLPYYALSHNDVASFSRYPLREEHQFPDSLFKYAALSVVIDSPLGELSLCNVHLDSLSEDGRLKEAEAALSHQAKYNKRIILGDFNALSRSDHYGDLSAREFTHYDLARFEVSDMLGVDHVDVGLHLNVKDGTTHPTIGVGHPISKTPVRIDYIFVTPSLSTHLKKATVIKTDTAEKASDHYPVVVTLSD